MKMLSEGQSSPHLLSKALMQPISAEEPKRHNLFVLAFEHFPWGMEATAVGIAALSAPFLYGLFRANGVNTFLAGVVATGLVIIFVPTLFLYLVTLLRSPSIRTRVESEAERELEIMTQE